MGATNLKTRLHRDGIKKLYSAISLEQLYESCLMLALERDGDTEFSQIQRQMIQDAFPGFCYDFCTTSTVVSDHDGQAIELKTICLDLPDDVVESYIAAAQYDDLSPVIYKNPGRALMYSQFCPDEDVKEHPFFKNHCAKYGIHTASAVGYLHPGHRQTFITFDYLGAVDNEGWYRFDHSKLELASFPFALAWLFRRSAIDLHELSRCFKLLEGMKEAQLSNLRKFINSPHQTFDEQAKELGITAGTLKDDLRVTRNRVHPQVAGETKKQSVPLRVLEAHYGFLRMLGDHTQPIQGLP